MRRRKNIIILIIFFGLINLQTECGRNYPAPPAYEYSFAEKIMIAPYQLDYNVGDTIQLQLDIPGKKLFDTKTNSLIFYDSVTFNIGVNVNLLFNDPYIGDGPFASFIFNPGVSAYTTNYSGTTQAFVTTGCTAANNYTVNIGVVFLKKGVFGIGEYCSNIMNCYTGYATNAEVRFSLDVNDTHKDFYQQLPLQNIGKMQDRDILSELDSKVLAIINVH